MSSTIPVPGKCNTPCKYHKKGACKMGAACRFLHVNPKKRPPSPETQQLAVNKTVCNQICKFGRRPFLHMVVLYASDPRVTVFAQEVLEKFLKHGIDVAVQRHLVEQNKFSSSPTTLKKKDVRTEHLAEIICSSHADFLIVLGDRNMKNKSCQAKRKGKLMEMKVLEMISLIWKSWPQNPQKTLTRIQNLTQPQTETLLLQYCGLRHAFSRVQYLEAVINDLKTPASESTTAEEQNLKLENVQKCCVRLHKQLKKCFICVGEVTVQTDTQSTRGCVMTLDYKPNSSRAPRNSISLILQKYLQKVLYNLMKSTEECVAVHLQGWQIPMWDEYIKQHSETFSVDVGSLEIAFEAPPPPQVETFSDDEDSDYESELSDESDLSNLADLEIEDDTQSESGFGAQTDEDEADSERKLSRSSFTKARSVSSPSRMLANNASRTNAWYGIQNMWGPDDSDDSVVTRGISEPVLPSLEFERYPVSTPSLEESDRAWLAAEAVWYNQGREEILSRESPHEYNFAEAARKGPPGFSAPVRSSFEEPRSFEPPITLHHGTYPPTKKRSKTVSTSVGASHLREQLEQPCQFYYPTASASLSPGRALSPSAPPSSGRHHSSPGFVYSHGMGSSTWSPNSPNWATPSPTQSFQQYHTQTQLSPPPNSGMSSYKDSSTPSTGRTKPVRSATVPSGSMSPYRGFNATIGAHLQEQQQTKTISLFDNPSPLSAPFTAGEETPVSPPSNSSVASASSNVVPTTTAPLSDPLVSPSFPSLSPNTAPFIPSTRTSAVTGTPINTQFGVASGSGMSGSPRLSSPSSTLEVVGTQFSTAVGGFTDKPRSPLGVSTKSPRGTNGLSPHSSPARSKSISSEPTDFETISQIWGDDHALFDVSWPWASNGVQNNTEVTVRSSDYRAQKTFSSSF